jgi:hypothetical protein
MKKIINFLNPIITLILFLLFIISVIFIYRIDPYEGKKIRSTLLFLYFIPGLFIFMLLSINNIKKSKVENNLKNKILSTIPLTLVISYFLFVLIQVLYAIVFHD